MPKPPPTLSPEPSALSLGLPPILGPAPRVLLLGSMPGAESLRQQRYYAHPRNAFWPILCDWLGVPTSMPYAERCAALTAAGVAVWDVLASCHRPGSLDAAIRRSDAVANDLEGLLHRHVTLRQVACNGQTAAQLYERQRPQWPHAPRAATLPSTSPAHAAMSLQDKRRHWHEWLDGACPRPLVSPARLSS